MEKLLVLGAGKIGSLVAFLLANSRDYHVYLADNQINSLSLKNILSAPHLELVQLDVKKFNETTEFIKKNRISSVISCLPYFQNSFVIQLAAELHLNYFDLTEDIKVAQTAQLAATKVQSAFVPQCGLAPGFISIVTHDLVQHFDSLDTIKMRVGALPVNSSNALRYALTWSTDGLINEYGNHCQGIEQGKAVVLHPLQDLEAIEIDGLTYEAFNTSGGAGTLVNSYLGKVNQLNYKTIRYPGHCEKIRFLMDDLKLNDDRETLKRILENAIPHTLQDVVIVYASVTGKTQQKQYSEKNYVKKFYPKVIHDISWSAIQMTTASSVCAIVDLVLSDPKNHRGLIKQEQFSLKNFEENRFGSYFKIPL